MKTISSIFIIIGLSISLYGQDKAMQDAATKAFGELKALAALETKMPNMPSPASLANARLGEMMPQSIIKLDALQKYHDIDDPRALVEKTDRVTYPVVGPETEVISSFEIEKVQNAWRTADLNNSAYVKAYDRVRKENNLITSECALIRVPAFNLYFLAKNAADGVEMALLSDKPFNDITPNRLMPAKQVMIQLNAVAKNYNGLPW